MTLDDLRQAVRRARRSARRAAPVTLKTAEARVTWCLDFAARDAVAADGLVLATLAGQPRSMPPPAPVIAGAQRHLRDSIDALVARRHFTLWTPETTWMFFPPGPPPDARRSALITRQSSARWAVKFIPSAVVLGFVDDLNAIGADRLRACPLVKKDGQPCTKVFLAEHRLQKFCDKKHTQAAAWLAYEPTRKKNRKDH